MEETDAKGHRRRTTRNKDLATGTPRVSGLAIVVKYLHAEICKGMEDGRSSALHFGRANRQLRGRLRHLLSRHSRTGQGRDAGEMSKLKLTVNETKTRLCRLPEETFDFLGYTLGRN